MFAPGAANEVIGPAAEPFCAAAGADFGPANFGWAEACR